MSEISLINARPSKELSSTLPTNGETYVAPAFDDSIACAAENMSVTFTLTFCLASSLHALSPSGVQGTLIVTQSPNRPISPVSYTHLTLPTKA